LIREGDSRFTAAFDAVFAGGDIRIIRTRPWTRGDVDLAHRLVVRHGKFGKTRELVLHPTTVEALRGYQRLRDRLAPQTGTPALLCPRRGPGCSTATSSTRSIGLSVCRARPAFRRRAVRAFTICAIRWTAGLCALPGRCAW
jgi:hypothetical protein